MRLGGNGATTVANLTIGDFSLMWIAFTPNFGQISSAGDSRQLQLAVKLIF